MKKTICLGVECEVDEKGNSTEFAIKYKTKIFRNAFSIYLEMLENHLSNEEIEDVLGASLCTYKTIIGGHGAGKLKDSDSAMKDISEGFLGSIKKFLAEHQED